jgi:pyridoxine 5-phosphate synthase
MSPAVKLSVNVNKVATLRNSRGGSVPSVVEAVRTCVLAGAPGITVHPRADERHIRRQDVLDVADVLREWNRDGGHVEYNIEGDPRPDLMDLVVSLRPDQCTLVPVMPGEITSQAGWQPDAASGGPGLPPSRDASADRRLGEGGQPASLPRVIPRLRDAGVRVSLFVEADEDAIRWAAGLGADRVELYTEPYARAFHAGPAAAQQSFARYVAAAERAHSLGLGVNAGHDLDTANLGLFRTLPHLAEVSIGHALMSRALWIGLDAAVREYLDVLRAVE